MKSKLNRQRPPIKEYRLMAIAVGVFLAAASSKGADANPVTVFQVGKAHSYIQSSPGTPLLDGLLPFLFSGGVLLGPGEAASSITLTMPGGVVGNLRKSSSDPSNFLYASIWYNSAEMDAAFLPGNYVFNVQSASGGQSVPVTLPALTQPNVPHLANYAAAQAIDPALPFTLAWDAFIEGNAEDGITATIGNTFHQGLPGTATSVQIPAGTLQANSDYTLNLQFTKLVKTAPSYITVAYRASVTKVKLHAGGLSRPVLSNAHWTGEEFCFEISTTAGETISVLGTSDLLANQWELIESIVADSDRVEVCYPLPEGSRPTFYRVRTGP